MEDLARPVRGYFEHQRRVQFEGCAAEPLTTITAFLPGSEWSCLLLRIVLQDALNEVTKIYPPLKLRVSVDDITALLVVKNKVVAGMAKKVMKKLREEVERKGLELSVTEDGKEAKSKMIASCVASWRMSCVNDSMDTLGVDLRPMVKKLGAKEKARRKKCRARVSLVNKNKALQKSYMKVGVRKLLRAG